MTKLLRCIVGARVSTDEQAKKGVSLDQQLEAGRTKAEEIGGRVVGYCIEPGISGALYEGRSELQNALSQVEAGEADVLIWYDLSRMSRDIEYISAIDRRVQVAGGRLMFCTTEYAQTADGFLHRGIDGVVRQHQRLKTKELSEINRRKVVNSGRQTQRAWSPIGYHIVSRLDVIRGTHTTDQLGHYEIVPERAEIVKEIFERYAAGESLREICRALQARGVLTPRGRKTGIAQSEDDKSNDTRGTWRPSTIRTILENMAYCGQATYGKSRGVTDEKLLAQGFKRARRLQKVDRSQWLTIPCPSIVSVELWEACQERLRTAQEKFSATADKRHVLSGLVRCHKCRKCMRLTSKNFSKKKGRRVMCHCPAAFPGLTIQRQVCNPEYCWQDELLPKVIAVVIEATTQPEQLEAAAEVFRRTQREKYSKGQQSQLEENLKQLDKKIEVAVEAQLQAQMKGIDAEIYETVLREASSQRAALRVELERITTAQQQLQGPVRGTAADVGSNVIEVLSASELIPALELNRMLALVIDAIYFVKEDGEMKITVAFRKGSFDANLRHIWTDGKWQAIAEEIVGI